jgi:hypothetical protein
MRGNTGVDLGLAHLDAGMRHPLVGDQSYLNSAARRDAVESRDHQLFDQLTSACRYCRQSRTIPQSQLPVSPVPRAGRPQRKTIGHPHRSAQCHAPARRSAR